MPPAKSRRPPPPPRAGRGGRGRRAARENSTPSKLPSATACGKCWPPDANSHSTRKKIRSPTCCTSAPAFGCASEVHQEAAAGAKINGITCLCWNYPCAGFEPLIVCDGRIAARIGYGGQDVPGQFLATLALAGVEAKYPLRVDKTVRTVADLVEQEKRSCRHAADLSARLIGLSYYVSEPLGRTIWAKSGRWSGWCSRRD